MRFAGCQGHGQDGHWSWDVKRPRKGGTGHCGFRGQWPDRRGRSGPGPKVSSNEVLRGLAHPAGSLGKGRLLGLGLGTRKTWDSPGSPLLPGLPRRPGGPRQGNKDRFVEKGSQWVWAQLACCRPTHPSWRQPAHRPAGWRSAEVRGESRLLLQLAPAPPGLPLSVAFSPLTPHSVI